MRGRDDDFGVTTRTRTTGSRSSLAGFSPGREEDEIEDLITSGRIKDIRPTAEEIGRAEGSRTSAAISSSARTPFPRIRRAGMKIVLDCSNGATYRCAAVFRSWEPTSTIHCEPTGQHQRTLGRSTPSLSARCASWGRRLALDGDATGSSRWTSAVRMSVTRSWSSAPRIMTWGAQEQPCRGDCDEHSVFSPP